MTFEHDDTNSSGVKIEVSASAEAETTQSTA